MFPVTYGLVVNLVLSCLYFVLILLVIQRLMEQRQFTYRVFRTPTGLKFEYKLGIYAGVVTVIRDITVLKPSVHRKADGWEIVLPIWYTDKDLSSYVMSKEIKIENGNRSHINDLEVFKQVVLCKNDSLECIGGKLFCTIKEYKHK